MLPGPGSRLGRLCNSSHQQPVDSSSSCRASQGMFFFFSFSSIPYSPLFPSAALQSGLSKSLFGPPFTSPLTATVNTHFSVTLSFSVTFMSLTLHPCSVALACMIGPAGLASSSLVLLSRPTSSCPPLDAAVLLLSICSRYCLVYHPFAQGQPSTKQSWYPAAAPHSPALSWHSPSRPLLRLARPTPSFAQHSASH